MGQTGSLLAVLVGVRRGWWHSHGFHLGPRFWVEKPPNFGPKGVFCHSPRFRRGYKMTVAEPQKVEARAPDRCSRTTRSRHWSRRLQVTAVEQAPGGHGIGAGACGSRQWSRLRGPERRESAKFRGLVPHQETFDPRRNWVRGGPELGGRLRRVQKGISRPPLRVLINP